MKKILLNRNTGIKNIIAEELAFVFNSRIEALSEFINKSDQHAQDYSIRTFDEFFILRADIEEAVTKIKARIGGELGVSEELPELNIRNNMTDYYDKVLSPIISRYKRTNFITAVSENITDDSIAAVLGSICSSNVIELAAGYTGVGAWLLAGNSRKAQAGRLRKNVFNHIKGVLINTKVQIENELLQKWAYCDATDDRIAV